MVIPTGGLDDAAVVPGSRTHSVIVPPGADPLRLDKHLAVALPALSRARIQTLLEEGQVLVDGRPAKASQKVKPGQVITVEEPPPLPAQPQPQDLPLHILYQDDHLVVLDKAAGVVVHPAAGNPDGTLVNALLHHVGGLPPIGGTIRPGIVHRLDKDTSGVLVVAKGEQALRALQAEFRTGSAHKRYLALCLGAPRPEAGTYVTPYGRHPTARIKFTSRCGTRQAITEYRVLASVAGCSAIELTLKTGRTHQIRVHLSEHGHPILGDELYGGRKVMALPLGAGTVSRQMLHATLLCLAHPTTGQRMRWLAPLPDDVLRAAALVGLESAVRQWWEALRREEPSPPGGPGKAGRLRTRST